MAMVFSWFCLLLGCGVGARFPCSTVGAFLAEVRIEGSDTGFDDVPPSVQSEQNVQSLEVDLSRLFQENVGSFFSGCCDAGAAWMCLEAVPTWLSY